MSSLDYNNDTPPVFDIEKELGGKLNIREELDEILRSSGFGSMSHINYLTFTGFNYFRHGQQLVKQNRDHMGFVFFTRPILNLTYDNLSVSGSLSMLRNAPPESLARGIRALLDPWSARGGYTKDPKFKRAMTKEEAEMAVQNNIATPMVNNANPFIPLLSNCLTNLSGWKDITLNSYTSKAGVNNEQWSMVDGYYYKNEAFEMSSSFRNIEGDPISLLFQTWLEYMGNCGYRWEMNPYPCFVEEREWDYNSCIYRFVMDHTKTYITKWATTIATPLSLPYGDQFNFSADKNFNEANNEITVTWQCNGIQYNDPITFYNFNQLVALYEPQLQVRYDVYDEETNSLIVEGSQYWQKLRGAEKFRGLYLAVPLINYITRELEWWVKRDDYIKYIQKPKPTDNSTFRTNTMNTGPSSSTYSQPITDNINNANTGTWI